MHPIAKSPRVLFYSSRVKNKKRFAASKMIKIIEIIFSIGVMFTAVFSDVDNMENYRWTNQVLKDSNPPVDCRGERPSVPYYDPPKCGWSYNPADNDKYYWETEGGKRYSEKYNRNGNEYNFIDFPRGGNVEFRTCLVDIRVDKEIWCKRWYLEEDKVSDRK